MFLQMPRPKSLYIHPDLRVPGAPGYAEGHEPLIQMPMHLQETPGTPGSSSGSASTRRKRSAPRFDPWEHIPDDDCPFGEEIVEGATWMGKPVLFTNGDYG